MSFNDADLYSLVEKLPKNDPAWYLLDAFDAVTNGMENPEAMKRTSLLENADLEPWKHLVNAIACLYSGDTGGCKKAAEKIGGGSPPASLKPLFMAWTKRQEIKDSGSFDAARCNALTFEELSGSAPAVLELFKRLIIEPHPLSLIAEQAEEALRQGLEEQFTALSSKVLGALHERSGKSLLPLRYAMYCLTLLNEAGAEGTDFFPLVIKTLGNADGCCALGFALIGRDNLTAISVLKRALGEAADPEKSKEPCFLNRDTRGSVQEIITFLESKTKQRGLKPKRNAHSQPELFDDNSRFIEQALRVPASFGELEGELPTAARYLGPGIWIKAIKESGG